MKKVAKEQFVEIENFSQKSLVFNEFQKESRK
jgi:hypothetical protein